MAALDLKQLEGKPWYYGLGIGVVAAIVLYLVANYYYPNFVEMKAGIEARKGELAALNQKIEQGRAAERRLPQLREEVRRIELDLQRLLQILPTARNTEDIIKRVEALARQGDFFIRRFAPKEYVVKDFYAEYPIEIQLDASYHNLALFFDRLARFSRIINIENLILTGYAQVPQGRTLAANFTAKTFVYIGDQPGAGGPGTEGAGAKPAPAPATAGGALKGGSKPDAF